MKTGKHSVPNIIVDLLLVPRKLLAKIKEEPKIRLCEQIFSLYFIKLYKIFKVNFFWTNFKRLVANIKNLKLECVYIYIYIYIYIVENKHKSFNCVVVCRLTA
jgi:hypothetical protein